MLTVQSLEASLALTELLDRSGVKVEPVPNSPLAMLVQATRSNPQFTRPDPNATGVYRPVMDDIVFVANGKDAHTGVSDHDLVLDQLVEVGVKAVQTHLQLVRNRAKPAIMELHDTVAKRLESLQASELLGMEVKIFDLPTPMKNGAFVNLIERYEAAPLANPAMTMKCPQLTAEEIRDVMKVGAAGFDGDVAKWLAEKGDTWLLALWEDVFRSFHNESTDTFRSFVTCKEEGLDYSLAIFLIARKLAEDPIEGITMSLPAFKALIAEYRDQAAGQLSRELENWAKIKKAQILVRWQGGKTVIVNECVYRPWIEAGGENEVLFGALLKNALLTTVPRIDNEKVSLKAAWNRHVAVTGVAEREQKFASMKRFLMIEFKKQIDELDEDGGPDLTAGNKANVLKLFKDELDRLKEPECDNLFNVCLKLVCRSRFHGTGAETFLLNIEKIAKENPNLEMREVATVATIEYVADWVAAQFTVSAING
jgi:hypothetical protein